MNIVYEVARGILVPKGTPAPVRAKLEEACTKATKEPGFAQAMKLQGTRVAFLNAKRLCEIPRQDRRREQGHHDRSRPDQEMSIGRDGIAGLILLAISLVLLVKSFQLPSLPIVPVGPGFYPAIVLSFMAAASALLVLQDLMKRRAPPAGAGAGDAPRRNYRLVVIAFAIVGAYVVLLPLVGISRRHGAVRRRAAGALGRPRTARQWAVLAAIALGTAAVAISCSNNTCWCCCRAAHGRGLNARSARHGLVNDRAVEIPAAAVCRHLRRRDRRLAARRHHHHDGHRGAAVHLRARSAGRACGDDRRLCRRIDRRPDHLLPARHTRLAGLDRHHVRRLSDGAQRRARPRHLARRLGVGLGRPARRPVPGVPHRAAGGDRAGIRAVGILLAVRARHGDGGGAHRSLAAQGTDLDRHRAADHGGRHTIRSAACRASPSARSSSAAAFRSCPC